jgi:hypothetical protein
MSTHQAPHAPLASGKTAISRAMMKRARITARLNGVNFLTRLPRELRDMIYEYALTEDGGLVADVKPKASNALPEFRPRRLDNLKDHRASNQLRLVCRQLYLETTGLGIRYNDITFVDTCYESRISAYVNFTRFVESCSRKQFDKMRRITIHDSPEHELEPNWIDYANLVRRCCSTYPVQPFCRNFPKLMVVVRFYGVDYQACAGYTDLPKIQGGRIVPVDGPMHLLKRM